MFCDEMDSYVTDCVKEQLLKMHRSVLDGIYCQHVVLRWDYLGRVDLRRFIGKCAFWQSNCPTSR